MGWTGTPVTHRLNTAELNALVDRELATPGAKITDRSGWSGSHRFTLMELEPGHDPETLCRRLIVTTLVQYHDGDVLTKHMDESVGPNAADCPLRILAQAEEFPPFNEHAAEWRARVREHHRSRAEVNRLLKEITAGYPNGNRAFVIDCYRGYDSDTGLVALATQQEVTFVRVLQPRNRTVNAYRVPGDNTLYRLHRDRINMGATKVLRNGER